MKKIIINTDGGARGNPGPAGAGFVIKSKEGDILKKGSVFLGKRSNNWAEYEAIYLALKKLRQMLGREKLKDSEIEVNLDSELVAKQINGEYQIKEETLFPQFIKIWNLRVKDFSNVQFIHIPREKNKEADELANKAMDQEKEKLF